jgi:hypothetical protein
MRRRDDVRSIQGSVSPSEFDAYPDTSTIYQGIKSLAPSGSNVQLICAPHSRPLSPPALASPRSLINAIHSGVRL